VKSHVSGVRYHVSLRLTPRTRSGVRTVAWSLAACVLLAGCGSAPTSEWTWAPEPAHPRPEIGVQRGLTLAQAQELAERVHPDLAAERASIGAAQGRADQAGAFPNPELSLRAESVKSGGGEYLAGVSQRIPIGGRLGAARRAEELDRERLSRELEARRLGVRAGVHAAFAASLHLDAAVRLLDESAADAGRMAAVSRALVAAGDGLAEDAARAELAELRARLERDRAASLRARGLVALAAAMGDASLRVESVEGALEAALAVPAIEALVARLGEHPRVRAGEADVAANRARIDLAEAQAIPDVTVDLLYRRIDATDENAFDAGIGLALPLFDAKRGRVREARAEAAGAEARSRWARSDVERSLREAHVRLSAAVEAARLLRDEMLPRAETVAKGMEARYAAGDASLADALPVRRERTALRLAYLETLREVMEAWSELAPYVK